MIFSFHKTQAPKKKLMRNKPNFRRLINEINQKSKVKEKTYLKSQKEKPVQETQEDQIRVENKEIHYFKH